MAHVAAFSRQPKVVIQPVDLKNRNLKKWDLPADDLRRKITAKISTKPDSKRPFMLLNNDSDEDYDEAALLKDVDDTASIMTMQINEEKLLADESDSDDNNENLDYEDNTTHEDNLDFETMSIAPVDNEFSSEVVSTNNLKGLKKKDIKRKHSESKLQCKEQNSVQKVINWQQNQVINGHESEEKSSSNPFKIPKKHSSPGKKVKRDTTVYKKQYNTNRHDRTARLIRKEQNSKNDNRTNDTFKVPLPLKPTNNNNFNGKNIPPLLNSQPNNNFKNSLNNANHQENFRTQPSYFSSPTVSSNHQDSKYSNSYTNGSRSRSSPPNHLNQKRERFQSPPDVNNVVRKNHSTPNQEPNRAFHYQNNGYNRNYHLNRMCYHFLEQGSCIRGDQCKFSHVIDGEHNWKKNAVPYGQFFNRSNSHEAETGGNAKMLQMALSSKDCSQVLQAIKKFEVFLNEDGGRHAYNNFEETRDCSTVLEKILLHAAAPQDDRSLWMEVSRMAIVCKQLIKKCSSEDFFHCARVYHRFNDIERCLYYLSEMKISTVQNKELKADAEKKLMDCIERTGMIFKHWNEFKKTAVNSGRVMDRIFKEVDFKLLEMNLTIEDLGICHQGVNKGKIFLSLAGREMLLRLYTPKTSVKNLVDLLKPWSDLSPVPAITVKKMIQGIHLADVISILSVLKRIPSNTLKQCEKQWNEFLETCCKQDNLQVSEQVFAVMQQANIGLQVNSSLHLLASLAKNNHVQDFLSRYNEVKHFFEDDSYMFPDWFSETISEYIDSETDWNLMYRLVTILIMSSIPPTDAKINDLLKMLQQKRRFQETYDVIMKCFSRNVILSQIELRRAIIFLEEWTSNYQASIQVYTKMREAYNRPEYLCGCHSDNSVLCRSKATSSSNSDGGFAEPVFPPSSRLLVDHQDFALPISDTLTREQKLKKLYAELSASDSEVSLLETYMKVVNMNAGNDNGAVFGVFFALTLTQESEAITKNYQTFVRLIYQRMSENIPDDISTALGRTGLRLIKYICDKDHKDRLEEDFSRAYQILEMLHEKEIEYFTCGNGFGTLASTKDRLSCCAIANMCASLCNKLSRYGSASSVFSYYNYIDQEYEPNLDMNEMQDRIDILYTTMTGLIDDMLLDKAQELYDKADFYMLPEPIRKKVANSLCEAYCCQKNLNEARKMYKHIDESNLGFLQQTVREYVVMLDTNNMKREGERTLLRALQSGLYNETFNEENPLNIVLSTNLCFLEIRILIEAHLNKLRVHPTYGEDTAMLENSEAELVIEMSDDGDIQTIRKALSEVQMLVCNQFNPPLQVKASIKGKLCIALPSVLRWYPYNKNNLAETSPSTPGGRNKRTVSGAHQELLQVTYCPTPLHPSLELPEHQVSSNNHVASNELRSPIFPTSPLEKVNGVITDETEVRNLIRKKISLCLQPYFTKSYITKEEYPTFSRDILEGYLAKLRQEHGCMIYNEEISLDVYRFTMGIAEDRVPKDETESESETEFI